MSKKSPLLLAILVIMVIGILFLSNKTIKNPEVTKPNDSTPAPVACTLEAKVCPDGSTVGRSGPNCEFAACPMSNFSWIFTPVSPTSQFGAPRNKVTLITKTKTYNIGTFEGNCSKIDGSSWALLPGEIDGVICYFAGGGTEVGIYKEKESYVAKVGPISEGDAETAGQRGFFENQIPLN